MDANDQAAAAFRRASYGLYALSAINLLGGMLVLSFGDGHEGSLYGSLAFFEALIKLGLAYYVWRASRVAAITALVFLATRAALDVLMLLNGGFDAILRIVLAGVVIWWLRRALVLGRRSADHARSRTTAGG